MDINQLEFQPGMIRQALTGEECATLLDQLPGWHIETAATPLLAATFDFPNFVEALSFANRVGELAERFNHHPELVVTWGKVTAKWWTHTARGVTVNDFVLARETGKLSQ